MLVISHRPSIDEISVIVMPAGILTIAVKGKINQQTVL